MEALRTVSPNDRVSAAGFGVTTVEILYLPINYAHCLFFDLIFDPTSIGIVEFIQVTQRLKRIFRIGTENA